MIAPIGFGGFDAPTHFNRSDGEYRAAVSWLADHNRAVAEAHAALAGRTEQLMGRFVTDKRSRTSLRTFARHNRRAAWQHREMAQRAEALLRCRRDDFDLGDVVS